MFHFFIRENQIIPVCSDSYYVSKHSDLGNVCHPAIIAFSLRIIEGVEKTFISHYLSLKIRLFQHISRYLFCQCPVQIYDHNMFLEILNAADKRAEILLRKYIFICRPTIFSRFSIRNIIFSISCGRLIRYRKASSGLRKSNPARIINAPWTAVLPASLLPLL